MVKSNFWFVRKLFQQGNQINVFFMSFEMSSESNHQTKSRTTLKTSEKNLSVKTKAPPKVIESSENDKGVFLFYFYFLIKEN